MVGRVKTADGRSRYLKGRKETASKHHQRRKKNGRWKTELFHFRFTLDLRSHLQLQVEVLEWKTDAEGEEVKK